MNNLIKSYYPIIKKNSKLIILVVILFFLVGSSAMYIEGENYKTQINLELDRKLLITSSLIKLLITKPQSLTRLLASNKIIKNALKYPNNPSATEKADHLLEEFSQTTQTKNFLLVSKGGIAISSDKSLVPYKKQCTRAFSNNTFFPEIILKKEFHFFAYGPITKKRGYFHSLPIQDNKGNITGIIIAKINIDEKIFHFYKHKNLFLVSPNGIILLSSNPGYLYKTLYPISDALLNKIKKTHQFRNKPLLPVDIKWDWDKNIVFYENAYNHFKEVVIGKDGWKLIMLKKIVHISRSQWILGIMGFGLFIFVTAVMLFVSKETRLSQLLSNTNKELEDRVFRRTRELINTNMELKTTISELKESEQKYKDFADSLPQIVYEMDINGNVSYFNHNALTQTGYSNKDLKNGLYSLKALIPEDREKAKNDFIKILTGKDLTGEYSYTVQRKDGSSFPIIIHTNIIYKKSKPIGYRGIVIDITARKKAEEMLAAEKEQLSVTLRSISDGVITTDTSGTIVLINKVAENLTGWPQELSIGKPIGEIFHIVDDEKNKPYVIPIKEILRSDKVIEYNGNIKLISKDGKARDIIKRYAPIHDKENKTIGVVIVFQDITEKKKIEEELQKSQRLESVGILAGGIAHDFNNYLTAIIGNITICKMETDSNHIIYERLREAEKASSLAKNLTKQLLSLSRGGVLVKKTVSIQELIKNSAYFILSGSNVLCKISIVDDIWPVKIDEGQITQVINNLIINSSQAMPGGGIINIIAKNLTIEENNPIPLNKGNYVKIYIKDDGTGISKEYLQKIFDPFFTTKKEGSGLGLSTSYTIIKKHDGLLTVNSEEGVGTTFFIYLPAIIEEIQTSILKKEIPITGQGRILVMDDDFVVRDVISKMLSLLKYDSEFATYGSEAIELYKKAKEMEKPFNAVIMDLIVPGAMGGEETLKKLIKFDPQIKVIATSGQINNPLMENFKEYGFTAAITKPFVIRTLGELLQSVLYNTT